MYATIGVKPVVKSSLMYIPDIDSYNVDFFIVLRSYVCRILDLYQVLMYVCGLYWFLMSTFFWLIQNSYIFRIRQLFQNGIFCWYCHHHHTTATATATVTKTCCYGMVQWCVHQPSLNWKSSTHFVKFSSSNHHHCLVCVCWLGLRGTGLSHDGLSSHRAVLPALLGAAVNKG